MCRPLEGVCSISMNVGSLLTSAREIRHGRPCIVGTGNQCADAREGWRNVQMVKQQVTSDFSEFRDKEVNDDFEQKVDKEIIPALVKGRNRRLESKRNK